MSRKNKNKRKRGKQTEPKSRQVEMRETSSTIEYERVPDQESSEDEASGQDRKLKVYIYDSEFAKIKNWVLLHKNIETGGDLFGLWVDAHTAVVQFALGPGKKCNRYETSFFQDLDYLATAGGYLTKKHGLCNLGQWHSHHQLSLNRPSSGDENTVWGHMPTLGLKRYIVCIANISKGWNSGYHASVKCFLFELNDRGEKLSVLQGKFQRLKQPSPVNEHSEIAQVIAQGAESIVKPVCDSDDEDSTSSESCWFKCKCSVRNACSKFTKWSCSGTGKALIIIGLLSVSLIVVGSLFLFRSIEAKYYN
jgi:hypothetical protein